MEKSGVSKGKGVKSLILKTWKRCGSVGSSSSGKRWLGSGNPFSAMSRTTSCPRSFESPKEDKHDKTKRRVTPEGCFSVCVGPQKQRFVIKTECVNHPLFKMLLEEAELEYGYSSEGPLALPCNVDLFCKVLSEMDGDEIHHQGCSTFVKAYGSYSLLSPSRFVAMDRFQ